MKKILVIHTKYRITGGEDIAVESEVSTLKDKFHVETLFFSNKQLGNYFLQLIYKSSSKNKIHNLYNKFIMMSYNCIKYNLNYENLFLEFKYKVLNE